MPEKKHRIVIDTNLWISFLLTRDFSKLDRLMSLDQTILLISQELLEEIVEVAERPKLRKYLGRCRQCPLARIPNTFAVTSQSSIVEDSP